MVQGRGERPLDGWLHFCGSQAEICVEGWEDSSIRPLFPSALGLPSMVTAIMVTADSVSMKQTRPYWVAVMATLFLKMQR